MKSIRQNCLSFFIIVTAWSSVAVVNGNLDWANIDEGLVVGPGVGRIHETDFCNVVRDENLDLKDALVGRDLSIAIQYGEGFDFFQYDPTAELSQSNPTGMIANLLDQLASRAGFEWRNSFVAYNTTTTDVLFGTGNGKWDRMLNWATSNFDLSVDKWFLTTERLESETVFLNSWFDATLILVDEGDEVDLNWLGFAAPFDAIVWWAILGTIAFSAVFMMFIEYLEDARRGRSLSTWFGDHLYLSNMAFSQNFAYENPISGAGRVFLSSFAFWAMLIGATYTANLASLLVENALSSEVNSIESAMKAGLSVCIHDGSASETIVRSLYPSFQTYDKVVKCSTPSEMYTKLNNDQCDFLLGTRQEFEIYKIQEKYGCGLIQAGNELHSGAASFAIKFDPLNCDSVLAYVMNIHLHAMSVDGSMTDLWDSYIDAIEGTCSITTEEENSRRRALTATEKDDETSSTASRNLKGKGASGGGGASEAEAAAGSNVDNLLKIKGMAGVFLFHLGGTILALLLTAYAHIRARHFRKDKKTITMGEVNKIGMAEKQQQVTKKKIAMNSELERRYEELKQDFMSQLDDLFQAQMARQNSAQMARQNSSRTRSTSTMFIMEEDYPAFAQTGSTSRTRRISMDGAITSNETSSQSSLLSL